MSGQLSYAEIAAMQAEDLCLLIAERKAALDRYTQLDAEIEEKTADLYEMCALMREQVCGEDGHRADPGLEAGRARGGHIRR